MSVLSDRDIRAALEAGTIKIEPYDPEDLQPSSVDLHLDRSFRVFRVPVGRSVPRGDTAPPYTVAASETRLIAS